MVSLIKRSGREHSPKRAAFAMVQTDLTCKTAEFPDGRIKTQSAEELQVKRRREIASIDQAPSHKKRVFAMEQMDPTCRTAESQDGRTRIQFAEVPQAKRRKETALIDQVLLHKSSKLPVNNSTRMFQVMNYHSVTVPMENQAKIAATHLLQNPLRRSNPHQ